MKELVVTPQDLCCFGGFLQIVRQNNIRDFADCNIILQGEVTDYTLELFVNDAQKLSKHCEMQFASVQLPLGKNEILLNATYRKIPFAKKVLDKNGNEVNLAIKYLVESDRIKNPISGNRPLEEKLLANHTASAMEKYWEAWRIETLKKAVVVQIAGFVQNTTAKLNDSGRFIISNADDLYDYFCQFPFLKERVSIVGEPLGYSDELVFMLDGDMRVDARIRFLLITLKDGCIFIDYAPFFLSLCVQFSELQYFSFMMENLVDNLEAHIDAIIEREAEDNKRITVGENLFKTEVAVLSLYKKKIKELGMEVTIKDGDNFFKLETKCGTATKTFVVTATNAEKVYQLLAETGGR